MTRASLKVVNGEDPELVDALGPEIDEKELGPLVLKHVRQIDGWAKVNERAALFDRFLFWITKFLVLAGAGGTSALAMYDFNEFATVAALVSAVLTTVETVRPRGILYRVHIHAAIELRALEQWTLTRWDQIRLLNPGNRGASARAQAVVELLEDMSKRRKAIADTLAQAEAYLGGGGGSIGPITTK
ncbi:MAG: hypothetical protein IT285_00015 [Bdellovibrionales bacterium]|nr:hypothetical protein [Bdellovibrionales bacterium]